ncbi:hypothetical protein ABKN59_010469 [Abortiporus biennis]
MRDHQREADCLSRRGIIWNLSWLKKSTMKPSSVGCLVVLISMLSYIECLKKILHLDIKNGRSRGGVGVIDGILHLTLTSQLLTDWNLEMDERLTIAASALRVQIERV